MNEWKIDWPVERGDNGLFIVFEGIDGTGKSTQARMLAKALMKRGLGVVLTEEPSDGAVGRAIRSMAKRADATEEVRLFAEDRRDHVKRVIRPALAAGRVVVCDRYVYSSVAYQGARGVDPRSIVAMNKEFLVAPDLIFLLEIPVDLALKRIRLQRQNLASPFEKRKDLEAVAMIYGKLDDPLIRKIDGGDSVEEIHSRIMGLVDELIPVRKRKGGRPAKK